MKRLGQVKFSALISQRSCAARFNCRGANDLFSEIHEPLVVCVGCIKLHHGELRVMPRTYTLIAKVSVDLKDTLEAADDQSLEVKLRRDAQEHFHV